MLRSILKLMMILTVPLYLYIPVRKILLSPNYSARLKELF